MKTYRIALVVVVHAKSERKAIKLLDRLQAVAEPHIADVPEAFGAELEEVTDE